MSICLLFSLPKTQKWQSGVSLRCHYDIDTLLLGDNLFDSVGGSFDFLGHDDICLLHTLHWVGLHLLKQDMMTWNCWVVRQDRVAAAVNSFVVRRASFIESKNLDNIIVLSVQIIH